MSIGTIVETLEEEKQVAKQQVDQSSTATLILGEPGSGKTTSLRNLDPDDVLLIQTIKKPLPFRAKGWHTYNKNGSGSIYVSRKSDKVVEVIKHAGENGKKIIVVDDFNYLTAGLLMDRASEGGYQKYSDVALATWNIMQAAIEAGSSINVYLLNHLEDEGGKLRARTAGKMISEKIVLEGLVSIVIRSAISDGKHVFMTSNSGYDTVKTPIGMFSSDEIDNDLAEVDNQIRLYYSV